MPWGGFSAGDELTLVSDVVAGGYYS